MTLSESSLLLHIATNVTLSHVCTALTLSLCCWCVYNVYLHPLARFPGPLFARCGFPGSVWAFWQAYRGRYAQSLEQLHDRLGPVVRIGANYVSFSSSEAAQQIYAHGTAQTFPKSSFYRSFQVYPTQPSLFSEIHADRHAAFRRAISSAYSMNSMIKLEEYVEPLVRKFVGRIDAEANKGTVDMAKWCHYFAMDAVGELAFGRSFGLILRGSDPDQFLRGVSNLSHWGGMAGWLPAVSSSLRTLLKRTSGQPGGEVVGKATEPMIEERFAALNKKKSERLVVTEEDAKEERQDMLASFVKSKNPSTGMPLSQVEVLRTAISVVSAGSDTTATALTAFLGFVVDHPSVYVALQREIDQAFDEGTLTWPVQYAQAVKLDYLQACVKETLRLHPPISMSLPRIVNDERGLIVHDAVFPRGVQVSVSPFVLHRNTAVFGEDARQFNPDRWMELDEQTRRTMERTNLTFGGGARQCIGKNISLMELNKVLPTLLRVFTFRRPSSESSSSSQRRSNRSTWFLEVNELRLCVDRRSDVDFDDDD